MSQACTPADIQRDLKTEWPKALGSVGERIRQAHRDLGWEYSRTWNYWYGKVCRVDGHEALRLHEFKAERRAEERAARELQSERRGHDAREELDRALALVASHLAAEAAQGDRDAASALRKIVGAMDMA